ncbi:MAG: 50S ribosomal protein L4 [Candidatus Omnitrophica bacterium]|nr:50S ribosomal protein L4 [Candidatus Omnitrophota bacterium]
MKDSVSVPLYNVEGKEIDSVKLDSSLFDGVVNSAAIYQAVNCYRANQRTGLAQTKTRGEVSGGGRKPWKQKGTGRARVGSMRSPLWRHGGVVFGPHPRDFSYTIPKKLKDLSLKSALNEKVKEDSLLILDDIAVEKPKTKDAVRIFSKLKMALKKERKKQKVLLLVDKLDTNLKLALRNIGFLSVSLASGTNAYEVLAHHKIIITRSALTELTKRFKD